MSESGATADQIERAWRDALSLAAADRMATTVWAALRTRDPHAPEILERELALYQDLRSPELPLGAIPAGADSLHERAKQILRARQEGSDAG